MAEFNGGNLSNPLFERYSGSVTTREGRMEFLHDSVTATKRRPYSFVMSFVKLGAPNSTTSGQTKTKPKQSCIIVLK